RTVTVVQTCALPISPERRENRDDPPPPKYVAGVRAEFSRSGGGRAGNSPSVIVGSRGDRGETGPVGPAGRPARISLGTVRAGEEIGRASCRESGDDR